MEVNLKLNMKKIFSTPKILKNGQEGKTVEFPDTL